MPDFTCADCGATFPLSDKVLSRYPGWTPKQCRACRDGAGAGSGGTAGVGQSRARGGTHRGGGGRARGGVREENLTVAQVLDRYHDGPQCGVFTDGSAQPNPGPGGWGAVYVVGGEVRDERHGHEPRTTNNRMELTALLEGFDLVPEGTPVTVYSDSRLAVDTVMTWAAGWASRGWTRKSGPISNLDLVQALHAKALARPEVRVEWIRAHDGARWNEYADALATAYRRAEL